MNLFQLRKRGKMGTLVKRPEIMAFLDTTPASAYTWNIVGNGMTTGAYSYDANETSETYIVDDNATTTVDAYTISIDGEMKCIFGDGVYDFINGLRYNLAVGSSAETHILLIDKYDEISSGNFRAQLFNCSVSVSSYGGDGGATPTISFKINLNGTPKFGKATFTGSTPTFVETVSA